MSNGRICIESLSGLPVSNKFWDDFHEQMVGEIVHAFEGNIFRYDSFKAGIFSGRYPGIEIFVENLRDSCLYCIFFNVILTRQRDTAFGKKGSPLPDGHFSVTKQHGFYKFWVGLGLPVPKSLTSFHERMKKLRAVMLVGDIQTGKTKVQTSSLEALEISYQEMCRIFGVLISDKEQTSSGELTDNHRITLSDKEMNGSHEFNGLQRISPTYGPEYVKSNQVASSKVIPCPPSNTSFQKAPQDQSVQEWLKDHDEAPG